MSFSYNSTRGISRKYTMYIRLASEGSLSFPPTYEQVLAFRDGSLKVGDFYKNSVKFLIGDAEKTELNSGIVLYGVRKGTLEGAISEVTPANLDILDTDYLNKKINILLEDKQNNEFYYIKNVIVNIDEEFDGSKSKIYIKTEKDVRNKEDYRHYFGYVFKVTRTMSFILDSSSIFFNYSFDNTRRYPGFAGQDVIRVTGSLFNDGDKEVLAVNFGSTYCQIVIDEVVQEEQGIPNVTIEKVGHWE